MGTMQPIVSFLDPNWTMPDLTELVPAAQERSRARQAQLAGRMASEEAKRCPFRPNAAAQMAALEELLAQDDSWLSD